jgi:hypothetical protein
MVRVKREKRSCGEDSEIQEKRRRGGGDEKLTQHRWHIDGTDRGPEG